ncbi:SGNH/GDSL hydrolase family protein [Paenibacillus sp. MMO-58]|uniref:SGNH/GDSL hydrolase family protein n=1 Tax=Paenibacillus sp. MMO-58 TaxID=3081290 RepID=UPI00301A3426
MNYKNLYLHNVAQLKPVQGGDAVQLCRIPDDLRLQLHEIAHDSALKTGSVEIRFHMKSDRVKLKFAVLNADQLTGGHTVAEVYHGTFQENAPRILGAHVTEIEVERPKEMELMRMIAGKEHLRFPPDLVRVILPYESHIALVGVEGETELPREGSMPESKMLLYGSSISSGASAVRPTGAYSMRTAEKLGVDLWSLSMAGAAMVDAEMADYIAQLPGWEFAFIELGINMIWDVKNGVPGSPEEFRKRVDYFISTIADAHPDKWIFVTDLFTYMGDVRNGELGEQFRSIVADKVKQMNRPKLIHIPGKELLTRTSLLTNDIIHPSEEGLLEISNHLAEQISRYLPVTV